MKKEKEKKIPRVMSLVKVPNSGESLSFTPDTAFIFFGEIPNMPDHCVVMGYESKKFYAGFHTDNFIECGDEEI